MTKTALGPRTKAPRSNPLSVRPVSPHVLQLRNELKQGMQQLATLHLRGLDIEITQGSDAVWAIVRRKRLGGIALRVGQAPGGIFKARVGGRATADQVSVTVESAIGEQRITLAIDDTEVPLLRATATLTPTAPLLIPYLPRDLYPLDVNDDPMGSQGNVEAAQRGLNTGVCYLRLSEPAFGSLLYVQNFTALNQRFDLTGTKPDGAVGCEWPELGYLPPSPPQSPQPPVNPLPAGETTTVYDGLIAFHEDATGDESAMAARYLALLAAVYRQLELPIPDYHDWLTRAEHCLDDLETAPGARVRHYGYTYLHPYTAAEYPDSMVQLAAVAALADYEAWPGKSLPLRTELEAGIRKFYDAKLRRCAATCLMSARIRTRTPSTAGICTIRSGISAGSRSQGTYAPSGYSVSRSTSLSGRRIISITSGRSNIRLPTSR